MKVDGLVMWVESICLVSMSWFSGICLRNASHKYGHELDSKPKLGTFAVRCFNLTAIEMARPLNHCNGDWIPLNRILRRTRKLPTFQRHSLYLYRSIQRRFRNKYRVLTKTIHVFVPSRWTLTVGVYVTEMVSSSLSMFSSSSLEKYVPVWHQFD